ncbi:hypothetical protein BX600DRAFT_516190 [Xylariales sp. PMI_506]|nr:hypothetical protein BX600DRAFT_516190 [Xylariales sp. PMI_506]
MRAPNNFLPSNTLVQVDSNIGKLFTVQNLVRIAGINIIWTDNLADHLRLADNGSSLFIFHHASFLKFQQRLRAPIVPQDFIEETLRTIGLLLPQDDQQTRLWAQSKEVANLRYIDTGVFTCGSLGSQDRRFERFPIWHDRLVVLQQAFDGVNPHKLSQWGWDQCNDVEWYAYWIQVLVAVSIILYGLVHTVDGGLKIYSS